MQIVEEPYHETLLEFMALMDVERIGRYVRDGEAMKMSEYNAYAFNAPDKLADAWKDKEREYEMEQNPLMTDEEKNALAVAKAKELMAEYEKAEFAGQVMNTRGEFSEMPK